MTLSFRMSQMQVALVYIEHWILESSLAIPLFLYRSFSFFCVWTADRYLSSNSFFDFVLAVSPNPETLLMALLQFVFLQNTGWLVPNLLSFSFDGSSSVGLHSSRTLCRQGNGNFDFSALSIGFWIGPKELMYIRSNTLIMRMYRVTLLHMHLQHILCAF